MNDRPRIVVVDHGAGNLVSIGQGLAAAGADVVVTEDPSELVGAAGAVLPGVGTTGAAMARLVDAGWVDPLRRFDRPLLGICVGLQLFFEISEEDDTPALGLIPGRVRRLEDAPLLPHIGWNDVTPTRPDPLWAGLESPVLYFVHSYAVAPVEPEVVIATTDYGATFPAAVRSGNRVGVQFHPERSGPAGVRMLGNFVAECRSQARVA